MFPLIAVRRFINEETDDDNWGFDLTYHSPWGKIGLGYHSNAEESEEEDSNILTLIIPKTYSIYDTPAWRMYLGAKELWESHRSPLFKSNDVHDYFDKIGFRYRISKLEEELRKHQKATKS